MSKKIHELEKTFISKGEVKGVSFTQVARTDFGYIYEVEGYYEVFERKLSAVCIDFKKRIYSDTEFKVRYPKAKDFGVWAWTTKDYAKALVYLESFKPIEQ